MSYRSDRVIGSIRRTTIGVITGTLGLTGTFLSAGEITPVETAEMSRISVPGGAYERILAQIDAGVVEGAKYSPTIAECRDGFVMAWSGRMGKYQGTDIYVQRLDAIGRPLGEAQVVNTTREMNQTTPAVAVGEDGSCWIAWRSYRQDGDQGAIVARRFTATEGSLEAASDEIVVNGGRAGDQDLPAVAVTASGRAVIGWVSSEGGVGAAYARLVDIDGRQMTPDLLLSDRMNGAVSVATLALLPGDRVAAVWAQGGEEGNPSGIWMRRVDADGHLGSEAARISSGTDGREHIEPSAAADSTGRLTIAWMKSRANITEGYDVVARQVDESGVAAGDTWLVADSTDGWKSGATTAVKGDGRVAISYNVIFPVPPDALVQRPSAPSRILTQVYSADGAAQGELLALTPDNTESHRLATATPGVRAIWTEEDVLAVAHVASREQKGHMLSMALLAPADVAATEAPAFAAQWANDVTKGTTIPPVFDPNWVPQDEEEGIAGVGPDFGFDGPQANGWYPPDPDIAAGPNHLVTVVNGTVSFYDKSGNRTYTNCLSCFWAELGANGFVFDPIALWDNHSSRFIVAAAEAADNGDSYIDLAISDDTDPNGTWYKYRVRTEQLGDFLDFPNLGVGPDAVYIAGDYFGTPSANQIHIFPKAPLLNGGPIELKNVKTTGYPVSLGAVKSYDAAPPAQYFISSYTAYPSLRIEAIRDATSTPVWNSFNLSVPSYGQPPGAPQKGTSNLAATVDFRIKNGVYRDGSLYATHAIAGIGVPKQRWYRIEMNGWPTSGLNPTLAEYGDVVMGSGIAGWFGDINVSNEGEVVMTMNRSSATEYISVQRTVKKVYDLNFRTPVIAQESTSPEQGSRWGDYSGLEEDPAAPGTFWGLTEYRAADWRTWVTRVDANKTMIVSASTLRAGQPGTLTATNCAAGGKVNFYYSVRGEGSTVIDALNVTLDIDRAKFIGSVTADASGVANLTRTVQPGTGNTIVWIQAAEWDNRSQVLLTQINR